ncbi:MAG: glycosyltransferase family 2 protein [Rhodospirillales bacterium]|nr:glycosyltransferase family 2 protein [Rhodospirillales bacterium]MCB9995914.1 glycosyltransferase family 2 protein [Rhodospirillales bacterium]
MAVQKQRITILVPCYNEQAVINICHDKITETITPLTDYDFEILYINDGSKDETLPTLLEIARADPRVTVIDLSRNFGKEAAMTAGLDYIDSDAVIILDADLQDPPELIPELIRLWHEQDADVVYGQRISRLGETWFKKFTAAGFYRVINRISRVDIPMNTGDFRLMNRRAIDALRELREKHRFMKGLFAWIGYKQVPLQYHRQPRAAGRTKWDYLQLWNLSLEGITGFSMTPLRLATLFGFGISLFAFFYGAFIIINTLFSGSDVPGYPSLMAMITFLSGIQLMTIGILGEYIGRIFNETKGRPLYLIDKVYKP